MQRQRQARAGRARAGGQTATPVKIPLPTSGLFVDAKTTEVSGLYAAELHNFRTDGTKIELRRQMVGPADHLALQRVPFEFGLSPQYVELRATQAECNGAIFTRPFNGAAMAAYISSQVIIADGLDDPLLYNGSTFHVAAFTVAAGASPNTLDGVIAHHDRLFFWRTDGALEFYYGDIGAVSGTLTRFPLDRLGNITGGIRSMMSLTMNAGFDANDALAIITTTGDVVIYEGLDPSLSTDWRLSTRLKVAPPLSRFGMARVGSDVWMMTSLGVVSLLDSLQRGVLSIVNDFSRPISDEILSLAKSGGGEWQLHTAADGSHIIINYYSPAKQRQWIWQTDSRAWATADLPARYWHNLLLSTNFTIGDGRLGNSVELDHGAEIITAHWYTSWFDIGRDGQITGIRPVIIADGPVTVSLSVLGNHNDTQANLANETQTVTLYPENPADPGGRTKLQDIIPVGAVGNAFQLRIEISAAWAQIVQMTALVQ